MTFNTINRGVVFFPGVPDHNRKGGIVLWLLLPFSEDQFKGSWKPAWSLEFVVHPYGLLSLRFLCMGVHKNCGAGKQSCIAVESVTLSSEYQVHISKGV